MSASYPENSNAMLHLEYSSEVVEQHHAYLRSLAARPPRSLAGKSRRQTIGRVILRLGYWMQRRSLESYDQQPVGQSMSPNA